MPLTKRILTKAKKVKLIILDADGVLTDGSIVYGVSQKREFEIAMFNAHDGYGISRALSLGVQVAIITGRRSKILQRRAKELGIRELIQGAEHKLVAYKQVKRRLGLRDMDVAYMGDDIPDLEVLNRVGFSAATRSAVPEVTQSVDFVSTLKGGEGAVREFIDLILHAQRMI